MDNKQIAKRVSEQSVKMNLEIQRKFALVNHRDVVRDLSQYPDKLELFQLQCLSMGTLCLESEGPDMDQLSDAFCMAAARASQLVAVVQAADDIVKEN